MDMPQPKGYVPVFEFAVLLESVLLLDEYMQMPP